MMNDVRFTLIFTINFVGDDFSAQRILESTRCGSTHEHQTGVHFRGGHCFLRRV
jgi:hypothetical protein